METNGKKIRVLAVDDSKTMLAMMSAYLKGGDFELVATASSGAEALQKYQEHKPQLVLLDVVMPEITGVEILEKIISADSEACVVMVSSLGTENTVQDCLKKGAKSFVQKPIKKDGMLATLKTVCQEAGVAL
ncbi:MAG: response regulator [Candidatus Binatia bacterium]